MSLDRLAEIASSDSTVIPKLFEMLHRSKDIKIKNKFLTILGIAASKNIDATVALVKILQTTEDYVLGLNAIYFIKKIFKKDLLKVVVQGLKIYMEDIEDIEVYEILWHCAQNMTYPEFYRAWHGEPSPLKNLENQFTDIHSHLSQLQPTEKTYPLTLNLKTLQDETDILEISQEICNKIYLIACPENPEIPQVNNAPQLKNKIPQIKKHLQTENLALIINNCEPNQEMIKFCNKLTDVLHIAFITKQPLDAPLKRFPNQPNLLNVIQHWINEI